MKIYFIDYPNKKISKDHEKYWLSKGHEVKFDMYFDINKALWADVIICFWAEKQAMELSNADLPKEKIRVVQFVDIEAYQGPWRSPDFKTENIDHFVFMSQHIKDYCVPTRPELARGVVIPLCVNTNDFSFRERSDGLNIAFIAHLWSSKGVPMLYQFFSKIRHVTGKDFKLHIVGTKSNENWLHNYLEYITKELNISEHIYYIKKVPDMNQWLEDKNYLISTSYKDSFSLVVGEAMSKGIKTLIHNWHGAKDIWPQELIWTTFDELIDKFVNLHYNSNFYHSFVEQYSVEKVLPQWDRLFIK